MFLISVSVYAYYTFALMLIDLCLCWPMDEGPLISSKWVLVAGVGHFVLVLIWIESVLASVLSVGSIFASVFFVVPLLNPLVYGGVI